ncbi:hypothetical protein ABIE27_006134, partial [Paenibacillus sp. 4624]
GLGWVGLGWVGLGWVGLGWVGLGWVGLGWVGLGMFFRLATTKKDHLTHEEVFHSKLHYLSVLLSRFSTVYCCRGVHPSGDSLIISTLLYTPSLRLLFGMSNLG